MDNPFNGILGSGIADMVVIGGLTALGTKLKNKDANNTGADDAAGNAIIACGPFVASLLHGDIHSQRKSVDGAIAALQAYRAALGDA